MKRIPITMMLCVSLCAAYAQNLTAPVGIGTTTPTSTLEVMTGTANTANGIVLSQGTGGGNVNSGRLFFANLGDITTNSFGIYKNNNNLQFTYNANPASTSGAAGLVLANTGNIGIGTTNPVTNLQIGFTTGNSFITLGGGTTGASYGVNYAFNNASTSIYAQEKFDYDNRATRGLQLNTQSGYALSFNVIDNTGAYTNNLVTILGSGLMGIGTTTPVTKLDVISSVTSGGIRSASSGALGTSSGGGLMAVTPNIPSAQDQRLGAAIFGAINTGTTYKYGVQLSGYSAEAWDATGNGSYLTLSTTPKRSATVAERMRIDDAGNVSIGTTDPKGNKLAVNGSVIATSVTVKPLANWADYVFNAGYKLPALSELEVYINARHHLPDVPTEKEVKQNGQNLGEMNKILLQKVEELTLYLIEQNKQLAAQQKEIDAMKNQLNTVVQKINE